MNRKYKGMFGKDLVTLKIDTSPINRSGVDTSKMEVEDFMRFLKDERKPAPLR